MEPEFRIKYFWAQIHDFILSATPPFSEILYFLGLYCMHYPNYHFTSVDVICYLLTITCLYDLVK